jgi:biotin carboxyl carrier protein
MSSTYKVTLSDISLQAEAEGRTVMLEGGRTAEIAPMPGGSYRIFLQDRVLTGFVVDHDVHQKTLTLSTGGFHFEVRLQDRLDQVLEKFGLGASKAAKVADLKAPMPGLVHRVLVQPGQLVEKGTPLLVLVAMKMENMIKATGPGTISRILVKEGDAVEKGHVLIGF